MRNADHVGKLAWKIIGTGAAVLAAAVAEKGVRTAWEAATGKEPPDSPEDPDIEWREAVAWAVLSGLAIGVARLTAQRAAAQYYRRSSGHLPEALEH
jgi:hypothetical protein